MALDFIITGSGRCGTHYVARLLNETGIPAGHELAYGFDRPTKGQPTSPVGEVGWLALAHLSDHPEARTVALVRDPLATVNSLTRLIRTNNERGYEGVWVRYYTEHFGPREDPGDPIRFAMEWVARLTTKAMRECESTIRTETLTAPEGAALLFRAIGRPTPPPGVLERALREAWARRSAYGTQRPPLATWADLRATRSPHYDTLRSIS